VDHQVSSNGSGKAYSLLTGSTRSVSFSSNAGSSQVSAESTVDATLVALLNSLDSAFERANNDFAGSGSAFHDLGDDELVDQYGDEVEGIDALFDLIGA
jgi:hypothetical protein